MHFLKLLLILTT